MVSVLDRFRLDAHGHSHRGRTRCRRTRRQGLCGTRGQCRDLGSLIRAPGADRRRDQCARGRPCAPPSPPTPQARGPGTPGEVVDSDRCTSYFNNAAAGVVHGKDGKGIWDNTDAVSTEARSVMCSRLGALPNSHRDGRGTARAPSSASRAVGEAIAYGVSKAALLFVVRSLAKALAAPHTRVMCRFHEPGWKGRHPQGVGRNAIKRFGAADGGDSAGE